MLLLSLVSTTTFASNETAKVEGRKITYLGKTFTISKDLLDQDSIVKELANAKAVYAFRLSDITADTGNSSDWCDTYVNSSTGEFAVNYSVNDRVKNYSVNVYVVFSKSGAKVLNELPDGFEMTFGGLLDYGPDGKVAGYCYADSGISSNSLVVYIK